MKIKKMRCGHKNYGSILSFRDRSFFSISRDITLMKLKNFSDIA